MHPLHRLAPSASPGNDPTDGADARRRAMERRASGPTSRPDLESRRGSGRRASASTRSYSEIEWETSSNHEDSELDASATSSPSTLYDLKNDRRFSIGMKWESCDDLDVSEASEGVGSETNVKAAPSSRYDPRSMLRVSDLSDDEVEKESDSDDSSAIAAARAKRSFCRPLLVILLVVGAVVGASVGIGFLVTDGDPLAHRSAALELKEAQRLLELAESIVAACGDPTNDECSKLCDPNMCCMSDIDQGDPCDDGIGRECAVYAGCTALLDLRRA